MSVWVLLALAGSGLAVGFLSGLVGIGGGVLIVPLLYFFYGHPGWSGVAVPGELEAVIAHATSLFVIVPTSALGAWTFHRSRAVAWRVALPIAAASMVAAVAGTLIAPLLPAAALKLGFGLLLVASGVRLFGRGGTPERTAEPAGVGVAVFAGIAIGLFSALLGVGGGVIAIPILVYLVRLELSKVAATSIGIIVFTAAAGAIGYAVSGAGEPGIPAGSVGYVHVLAALPILVGSMLAVPLGAHANQRLNTDRLRILFGVLFVLLGLRLVIGNLGALPGNG